MTDKGSDHTPTLAGLYADQGHYGKASDIYHHMISDSPGQAAIQTAYNDALQRKNRQQFEDEPDFLPLFRQWLDLLSRYRYLIRNAE